MLPPTPPSRRARRLDLNSGASPTLPSLNLPSGPSHPTPSPPGPPGFPISPDASKFLSGILNPSSTSSGSGSGSGSGSSSGSGSGPGSGSGSNSFSATGTSGFILNSTATPPPANTTTTSSSSSPSDKSSNNPLIFINGSPVPLLAIVLPIVFVFLAVFLASLFYFYRKARKSNTPPPHLKILLNALLIATFLWIPLLLLKHALRTHRRRARRGTLIVAGDAYSKLNDSSGALPPMARTPSPADAEFLGLYGRYAPQPPPVGVVVLRPGHGHGMMVPATGRYEPFAAPPPYEGPRRGGARAGAGAGEDEITPVAGRPATAPAGRRTRGTGS